MTMRLIGSYIAADAFPITASASPLAKKAYGIKCTGAGTVTYITKAGTTVTETVVAGERIPVIATHVTAATATGLIGYSPYDD